MTNHSLPMNHSFNVFTRVVTKHVLGSQERFNELKDRLAMCEHATSKAGAAALGYLIAMEEKEEKESPAIYDLVLEQVEDDGTDSCERTDSIFAAIYKWFDNVLAKEGYEDDHYIRELLVTKFSSYMP